MLVLDAVSQATLDSGSCSRQASRMASETWSHSLSGWPSLTDSALGASRIGDKSMRGSMACITHTERVALAKC